MPAIADLPDKDLMALITQGTVADPAIELFRRHNRALFNFIAWSCQGNSFEAEDICHKTWLRVMHTTSYQPAASFLTFLYRTAREVLAGANKSIYSSTAYAEEKDAQLPDADLTPEAAEELRNNLHRVRKAFIDLPALQRDAAVLRFFSDLSLEKIAAVTGAGFEAVNNQLRYAFGHLRHELG